MTNSTMLIKAALLIVLCIVGQCCKNLLMIVREGRIVSIVLISDVHFVMLTEM